MSESLKKLNELNQAPASTPSTKVHRSRQSARYAARMASKALHFCGCGQPATRYLRGGWACERCLALEARLDGERRSDVWHAREKRQSWEAVEYRCALTR